MDKRTETMLQDLPYMMDYLDTLDPIELLILVEIIIHEYLTEKYAVKRSQIWDLTRITHDSDQKG